MTILIHIVNNVTDMFTRHGTIKNKSLDHSEISFYKNYVIKYNIQSQTLHYLMDGCANKTIIQMNENIGSIYSTNL